jgi:hypothetical protein
MTSSTRLMQLYARLQKRCRPGKRNLPLRLPSIVAIAAPELGSPEAPKTEICPRSNAGPWRDSDRRLLPRQTPRRRPVTAAISRRPKISSTRPRVDRCGRF